MATINIALPKAALTKSKTSRRRINTGLLLSILWLAVLGTLSLVSLFWDGLDPIKADFSSPAAAPSADHLFGTDATGRDVFARTVAGARSSFAVAGITLTVGLGVGVLLGTLAGYLGGLFDRVIGILLDSIIAFPALILIMLVVTLQGPSLWTIGSIIGFLTVPSMARITRASTLTLREREFVTAARLLNASRVRIMLREVLPNVAPIALAYGFTVMTVSIVAEGSLSFLGFGLQPPTPSWGGIIADGRTQLAAAPWISLFPAITLCLTVLALNVVGERVKGRNS